jgi:hypothetical protein
MTGTAELTPAATSPTEGKPATTTSITTPPSSQPDSKAPVLTTPPTGAEVKPAETKGESTTGKPQGAPEKYEFKAPEGLTYNQAVTDAWSAVAKSLNLPQEAAQQHLDAMAKAVEASGVARAEAERNSWKESATSDKEFGGDAKKLAANLGVAHKAYAKYATEGLTKLLNETRLGDHPEVIRWFYRAGKDLSVDDVVTGSPPSAAPKSDAKLFYGDVTKK